MRAGAKLPFPATAREAGINNFPGTAAGSMAA
jgi:hypothetical protein